MKTTDSREALTETLARKFGLLQGIVNGDYLNQADLLLAHAALERLWSEEIVLRAGVDAGGERMAAFNMKRAP